MKSEDYQVKPVMSKAEGDDSEDYIPVDPLNISMPEDEKGSDTSELEEDASD